MAAFLPAVIGGGLAGLFGSSKPKPSQTQQHQQQLIDQLMASLQGNGPYSGLFQTSEEDFQRNYVDPARSRFKNQIAPQIQQSFIASGQQRGTGLEDTLSRAGVDLDQMLNQQYLDYQQGAQGRQLSAISGILGTNAGVPAPGPTGFERFFQGVSGTLSNPELYKSNQIPLSQLYNQDKQVNNQDQVIKQTQRKGYE